MDEQTKQSAFMNALVTEHFVLQSAASTTVSEAAGRAALYMTTLSSTVVAMAFVTDARSKMLAVETAGDAGS